MKSKVLVKLFQKKAKLRVKSRMNVPETEKIIGVETFFTHSVGVGGKLRTIVEDFIVEEISKYPPPLENGRYTIARVTDKNWETNQLVRELSNVLHVSRKRISFAGTKDKRALKSRLMSFYKIPVDKLSDIKIKDVKIENVYSSDHAVKIGELLGNKFEIKVRDIVRDVTKKNIQSIASIIERHSGFPNFYGIQRFGITRPITHVVGKHIVNADFEEAVMSYIANPIAGEDKDTYCLRELLQKTYDFSEALACYPDNLSFEKAILNKLVLDSEDFVNALKELPKNLLTMFIYAYQSYLFNRILSERIKRKLPLNKAVVGDIILPFRKNVIEETPVNVRENNIEKVNLQISRGRAFITGLLIGNDSEFSEGEMGEIEHKIIEEEKIDPRDFIIPEIPYLSSSGSRRSLLAPIRNLEYKLEKDELNPDKLLLNLKFELLKGCYATSLLREFMKADDIRSY